MTPPMWLIAEREFRAYAATLSFWIALAVGPLAMAGVLALAVLASAPRPPATVAIQTADPAMARSAAAAVVEAAGAEGRVVRLVQASEAARATTWLSLSAASGGAIEMRFGGARLLSAAGWTLVARTLERDAALRRLGVAPNAPGPLVVRPAAEPSAASRGDAGRLSRFGLVMMLWLTLTGSLGMLLQAVVRERSNRALESLLAAARPWEIVFGKLIGVGAVSVLVLLAWLGSALALAPLAHGSGGLVSATFTGLGDPAAVLRACLIYLLAFAFYGSVTVAVGAMARDTAEAQNLSRPMFAVLLAAFFVALAAAGGASSVAWLAYVPPFTPFMLLMRGPGEIAPGAQVLALSLLAAAAATAGWWAVNSLSLAPKNEPGGAPWMRRRVANSR